MGVLKYRDPVTGEWRVAGSYTGPVVATSFNGRTGDVVPQAADYAAFYAGKDETVDAYSKEETLSADTKALYGLEADATPDAAFARLHGLQSGGAKIATGSYVGTGTYGASAPNSLTFGFEPKLIFVAGDVPTIFVSGSSTTYFQSEGYETSMRLYVFWEGNTVRWYGTETVPALAQIYQLNKEGETYHYVAIG